MADLARPVCWYESSVSHRLYHLPLRLQIRMTFALDAAVDVSVDDTSPGSSDLFPAGRNSHNGGYNVWLVAQFALLAPKEVSK